MIFGPSAVGKMAVGRELSERTGYPLFHNHLSIEPIRDVFPHGSAPFVTLVREIRRRVIEEAVTAGLPGLIFTFVWALEDPADREYTDHLTEPVRNSGGRVDFVELSADQATRLLRNETPERLEHKRSKRDVELSRSLLLADDANHRLNTDGDFCYPDLHHRIDNSRLTPAEAADRIVTLLQLG